MSDTGVRGIVVAHGTMAEGMVDAVRHIAGGAADALIPVSNQGVNPEKLREIILEAAGEGPVLVFADLHSGSCGLAALATCRDSDHRAVLCGVNLPILLDFVFHRDMEVEELTQRLLDKGRAAICPLPGDR